MKIKNYVCKCGSDDFNILDRGFNVGIYCNICGKWFKWASSDERKLIETYDSRIKYKDVQVHGGVDPNFKGCTYCIHSVDSVEICTLRKCVHAIGMFEECYMEDNRK